MAEQGAGPQAPLEAGDRSSPAPRVGAIKLFLLFSQLGISSFGGGVPAWMHRAFVQRRAWLSEAEFSTALALARIMPGVNVVNLAVLIGQRLNGFAGAAAGALGLLIAPGFAVIALALLYERLAGSVLTAALEGCAVAAAGLLVAMGLQSGRRIVPTSLRPRAKLLQSAGAATIAVVMFIGVGVLRLPTVALVLVLTPLSIALVHLCGGARKPGTPNGGR